MTDETMGQMWPLDTTRPLAFFGSDDGKTWQRLSGASWGGANSFVTDEPFDVPRFVKVDYDDAHGEQAPKQEG